VKTAREVVGVAELELAVPVLTVTKVEVKVLEEGADELAFEVDADAEPDADPEAETDPEVEADPEGEEYPEAEADPDGDPEELLAVVVADAVVETLPEELGGAVVDEAVVLELELLGAPGT
jgi:hypothetical protein